MRIVLKFGSGVLATPRGSGLDDRQFQRLTAEIAALVAAGHQCLVVSSGAVAAGLSALDLKERPDELATRQACAAVGQSRLMQRYAIHFETHGLAVAQLLLTHGDLDSRVRHANACRTLECLFASGGIIPIINENDSVAVEELRFGDNDRLSAEVAILARADRLILLTSVDGLMDSTGKVIATVPDVTAVGHLADGKKGRLSVGGMASKLQAVQLAVEAGIPTWIAHGRKPGRLAALVAGRKTGTHFPPPRSLRQ